MNAVARPSNVNEYLRDSHNNDCTANGTDLGLNDRLIQPGDTVLLRLPSAEIKSIKLQKNTCGQPIAFLF